MAKRNSTGSVKLTQRFLSTLKPTGKREKYRDETVPGLLLRVGPDGKSKVWYFDYRNRAGQRKMFRIGALAQFSIASAKAEARKLAGIVADGGDPATDKTQGRLDQVTAQKRTIRAYLFDDYWTRHLQHKRSGKATQQRIASAWQPLIETDMASLTAQQLMDYRAKRIIAGVQASTLNRDRAALITLLNHAVEEGLIPGNPVVAFKRLKVDQDERVRYLSPSERQRFMSALEDQPDYFRVMVKLALLSGMRRGELLQLTWPNVNLRRKQITVRAHTAKAAKTRVIPLPPPAVELLQKWKAQQSLTDMHQHVFLNRDTRLPFTGVKRRWNALTEVAQIDDFRFHDCRHDYASRLVEAGVDLYRVKELLGHASIEQTQRYAHLSDDAKRAAVEMLT
jgi:integrase